MIRPGWACGWLAAARASLASVNGTAPPGWTDMTFPPKIGGSIRADRDDTVSGT